MSLKLIKVVQKLTGNRFYLFTCASGLSPNSSCEKVFDLGRGTGAVTITGLEYFRLRPNGEHQTVYGVLVTTLNKLYQFHGTLNTPGNQIEEKPFLLPLFHSYLNAKGIFFSYGK